ncbi:hypothetical protein EYC84_011024 [Monilinia fructicola]|uniref:Uncharacterized protein n=1 Tax=Monilinia fructicola TaxID=38448 RepID=A0A5M9JBQ8_MONFR|nr:hypothetical protein EYC84_011024 [Monilinia fructicola]
MTKETLTLRQGELSDMEISSRIRLRRHSLSSFKRFSVLNNGLLFDAYKREASRSFKQQYGLSQHLSDSPEMGVFGPIEPRNRTIPIITSPPQQPPSNSEDPEIVRKHQLEEDSNSNSNLNGPPGKKPRLTNGYENGISNGISNGNGTGTGMGMGMETYNGHAYPSPEQLPSPIVVTNGPEKGTQIDKVSELSTETIYLDLLDDNSSKSTVLLHCEWNPRIPKILAAAGTDSLARMWDLSRTVADQTNGTHPFPSPLGLNGNDRFPPCAHLLEPLAPPDTYVNALTWSSDGRYILVASESPELFSNVAVWSEKGQQLHTSAPSATSVISLKWNFSNTLFLSVSTEGRDTTGTVFTITSMTDFRTIQHVLPHHNVAEHPLEAVWTSDEDFVFETREDHQLSKITYDPISRLLATGSENGVIDIWDEQGHSRTFNAHTGLITSLLWQPLQPPNAVNETSERLLASSSEDGAISIWNARSLETKQKCSMTIGSSSVLALSFTPDGAFIAARWDRPTGNGCQTPQSSDSIPDEDEHVLSWMLMVKSWLMVVVVCWQSLISVVDHGTRTRLNSRIV